MVFGGGGGYRRRRSVFGGRGNRRRGQGRLTLFGKLFLVGSAMVLVGIVFAAQAGWRAWQSSGSVMLPEVSAAPPEVEFDVTRPIDPPTSRERFGLARLHAGDYDPAAPPRLVEWLDAEGKPRPKASSEAPPSGLRVEYTLHEDLTSEVFDVLRKGRVDRGHAIVIDPRTGRLLAYVSTDAKEFPPERAYPAASIVKILTAAAMLDSEDAQGSPSCIYRGNKYRLNRRRLDRPDSGRESGLEDALATSNNQCFSQWALHFLGEERLTAMFERFGWLSAPAPGHEPGRAEMVETKLDLGRLGSGLDGMRVTPLHVASLTSILTDGRLIEPWWVDRVVEEGGSSVALPGRSAPRRVLPQARAKKLREMLVATTTRGTAKSAFRTRRGRPLLGGIRVAGKTGNLTGRDPFGRYEWFVGLAPADDPRIGVVVLQLQGHLWWKKSSELAANILKEVFCERSDCRASRADRWTGDLREEVEPLKISDLETPLRLSNLAADRPAASSAASRPSS